MIEVIVKNYLDSKLEEQVFLERQDPDIGIYVLIEKTSSAKSNHLPSATMAVQSCANSLYNAILLNEKVKEAMENMIELDEIRGVNLNSDYNFTDITTKKYRYQAVFDIKYY